MTQVFTVGKIVQYMWGYGQTNQDFFKVVDRTPKTVVLQQLESIPVSEDGNPNFKRVYKDMYGYCVPDPDNFKDNAPVRKRVFNANTSHESLKGEFGSMRLWDGTPQFESWWY